MNGYLGIDVSKGYSDFILLDSNKKQLEEVFQFDDTRLGHESLKKQLDRMMKIHQLEHLFCGLESTGGFENNWYNSLVQWSESKQISVVRLNPHVVKSNTMATLQRNITDALSSRYIAEYLIAQASFINYSTNQTDYSSFRSLNNHINLQKKQQTQLVNQLKFVLYSIFPELLRYCKSGVPSWVLEVLKKYPSVPQIGKLKPEQLSKIKYLDEKKATSIINKAKSSVASRNNVTDLFLIKSLSNEIQQKQISIREQKDFLAEQCNGDEIDLLTSIPGIGKYSAAVIMIEIENINRFASPKELVSYFGVHPELKDSGDKKGVHRMSKRGRSSMRGALYLCAQASVLFDEHIKAIYHKHRSKGFNHKQAIGVIMNKRLRMIWGILTTKKAYNASVDGYNQKQQVESPKNNNKAELKTKRRFQELDEDAPISNRQNRTRKANSESQVSNAEQVRDHRKSPDVKI